MARFSQYETFVTVVETGSLSSAAKALNITPSAVSKQLSSLENSTKTHLLDRTNRQVAITESGLLFYQRCKKILADISEAEDELLSEQEAIAGRLSVTLSKSLLRSVLFEHFADFSNQFPKVHFNFSFSENVEDLHENRIDFAFRMGQLEHNSNLYSIPLCDTTLLFCGSPEYIKNHGKPNNFKELHKHKFIAPTHYNLPRDIKRFFKDQNLDLENAKHHRTDDLDAIYQSVLSGVCLGNLLDIAAKRDLESGKLINLFPDKKVPSKKLYLIYKKSGRFLQKHKAFRDYFKKSFRLQK